jgi:plastocyanin
MPSVYPSNRRLPAGGDDVTDTPPDGSGDATGRERSWSASRRRFLRAAAVTGTVTGFTGVGVGQANRIELGGERAGWIGREPSEISGETNPTLTLQPGTTYTLVWENLDGEPHNVVIENADGENLVRSEIISSGTQEVEFEATPEMAEYYCEVHPASMRGAVEVVGDGPGQQPAEAATFTVRVENVSTEETLSVPDGESQPVPLSPGAYAVFADGNPMFDPGEPAIDNGLEEIAEDGDPSVMARTLQGVEGVSSVGAFDTPVDAEEPSPIGPGGAYEFTVEAGPDQALALATMFVPSNDLFFSPGEDGVALFEGGEPVSGDVTDQLRLRDAGTEANEQPGAGENQVQRQDEPGAGPDESAVVRPISEVEDGFTYPEVSEVVAVTVTPETAPDGNATNATNVTGNVTNATGNVTNATGNETTGNATENATNRTASDHHTEDGG